jgi:hypothetical protein
MINIKNVFNGKVEKKKDNFVFLCKYKEIDNTLSNFNKDVLIDKSTKLNQINTSRTDISNLCINSMFSNIKIDNNKVIYNDQYDQYDQYEDNDQYNFTLNSEKTVFKENECRSKGFKYDSNLATYTTYQKRDDYSKVYKPNKYTNYITEYKLNNKLYNKSNKRVKKRVKNRFNSYSNSKVNSNLYLKLKSKTRFIECNKNKKVLFLKRKTVKLSKISKYF